ncbi:mono-functional DNA-alkylating methyl methanesulfonate N-term-domain-containing protein [Whalleya microplaca]|nr:mono-functional DNA-alkylating methyl methanesulfonate N-term-domain-containing protein [Whalleya microplaca]
MSSLQTYVLENDQWVARTISAEELMRERTAPRQRMGRQPPSKPPTCGLLTKTVIESPVVRWVLPVQLRCARYNDVALISDHSVQICQLGHDGQLQDIARKNDFGSRIRNALVMGAPEYIRRGTEDGTHVKGEDSDTEMAYLCAPVSGFPFQNAPLPPQLLILMLERGYLVFLFLRQTPTGAWDFVSTSHKVPGQRLVCPGFHMAIDPSWSYLTLACSENLFIMYQLESMETLRAQYAQGCRLEPIKDKHARAVKGIIHKIEFLQPLHGNEEQIILLIIIVQPEVSRLAVYEWERGCPLREVFSEEKGGYRLDDAYRMPLLVVPLKVRSAFLVITERITATCSDILSGPPTFTPFELANGEDTELHHGTHEPLWTAWTRPIRHHPFHANKDVIYLAREDGLINFLEIGDESAIETSVGICSVNCNIDSAFACLFQPLGDVLVTGGDSGPGAVWNVEARQHPQRIGWIPNWSPTVDFVVANSSTKGTIDDHARNSVALAHANGDPVSPLQPDRIFACSGRGIMGAITEFRYGMQAKIGLDLTYSSHIRQCWAISTLDESLEDGFYLLLALPHRSAVLHLSGSLTEVSEKDDDTIPYDLSSTTLAAEDADNRVVQITTTHIILVTPTKHSRHPIADIIKEPSVNVAHATIQGSKIAIAIYSGSTFKVVVLNVDDTSISLRHAFEIEGEVTCLALGKFASNPVVMAGLWHGRGPTLAIFPTEVSNQSSETPILIELQSKFALTSIISSGEQSGGVTLVAGTKNGDVLTIQLDSSYSASYEVSRDKYGMSPSSVFPGTMIEDSSSIFVCGDAEMAIMTKYVTDQQGGHFEELHRVWPTDVYDPGMPSPSINSVTTLHQQVPEYDQSTLVMIAGPRILITELQRRPKPVPRSLPVRGTPVKILYSQRLEALVTVISRNGLASLHFLDPTTGHDISHPLKIQREKGKPATTYYEVDYIDGLGFASAGVVSLSRWRYKSAGGYHADWYVLSVRKEDDRGLLLIVSAEPENTPTETGMPRRIRFWTKFKSVYGGPIRSVTTTEQGLFLCVGNHLQYNIIEQERFKVTKKYELPSPASWMQVVDGRLHVLTTKHSLIILDYKSDPAIESDQMVQLHTDDTCRSCLHSIEVGSFLSAERHQSITMLSDPMCGVHGLWSPSEDERPLKLVFRAELQASVRRFVRGNTRSPWNLFKNRPRYGCIQSGPPGSDILGLSIDGSLQSFALLSEDAWRLLRFIQNLAMASRAIYPYTSSSKAGDDDDFEPEVNPKLNMHVDGDILQRCLDKHVLEEVISEPQHVQRFRELLEVLDEGKALLSTQGTGRDALYYKLAYDILRYYLTPVL